MDWVKDAPRIHDAGCPSYQRKRPAGQDQTPLVQVVGQFEGRVSADSVPGRQTRVDHTQQTAAMDGHIIAAKRPAIGTANTNAASATAPVPLGNRIARATMVMAIIKVSSPNRVLLSVASQIQASQRRCQFPTVGIRPNSFLPQGCGAGGGCPLAGTITALSETRV